jgi:signal transduction histidine kinase
VSVALLGNAQGPDGLVAAARGLTVAVPVAVGIWAWHKHPDEPFGRLLVAAGLAWSLTTLAESDDDVVYSTGRTAAWAVELGVVYVILSFPSGRLPGRVDRAIVGATGVVLVTLYLPTILASETYPVPSPYTSCTAGCPENAFFVLNSQPGFVESLLDPLRGLLTALLFLGITARLIHRFRGATRLMQRALEPVLMVATARYAAIAAGLVVREASPGSPAVEALAWGGALAIPLMAVAFLLGFLSRRLYAGSALKALGGRVRTSLAPDELRDALATALADPSLQVVYPVGNGAGRWALADGRPVLPPEPGSEQVLTEVRDGERLMAAIVHDAALAEDREFLDAVASYAAIALKNAQLAAVVESSLREVRASRARIQAGADRERRRIERNLHDGAQQRLVALRIQVELIEELAQQDPEEAMRKLHALGEDVGATLDEIRALARGVYPPLLQDAGLGEALRAAALNAAVQTRVEPNGIGRYPQEVESAVYFCCLEAMQNAAKHARGVRTMTVSLRHDEALRFQVRDDGAGFDPSTANSGRGLTNMRDRMVAVGGQLSVRSSGTGTVVTGSVPLRRE